jgi:hypothetical protein
MEAIALGSLVTWDEAQPTISYRVDAKACGISCGAGSVDLRGCKTIAGFYLTLHTHNLSQGVNDFHLFE